MTKVKFCESNFKHGSKEVAERVKDTFKNDTIEVQPCLGYCADCALQPLAKIKDDIILADSKDDLFNKIKSEIENRK